ncbi:ribbon-helix-helix domain-containing protein [Aggregatibacter actinomycetemcomitans]|uniref:ribbon-helix-helix domain-containing protein n=1 Tax=Aggregatibacter actinomycetemcomitans TaxID=714 RepID=UPI0011D4F60D|nr:CopG family transcriptional regulator [Aggregatibacter actinomycetemcomitans]TYA48462.1 ribbon-helix-helix protein, CopG family [Aggregatibacter actinomycetemcomitans]
MTYKKLSEQRKKTIGSNANHYAKNNYKQIQLKLKPELAERLNNACAAENLSKPEFIKKLLDIYDKFTK